MTTEKPESRPRTTNKPALPSSKMALPVVLIGLRGSGKTSVGRVLAELLKGRCIDTDEEIQRELGNTIAEIFEREGEAGFRQREREIIAKILANPPEVLSVGGGAVLDRQAGFTNRQADFYCVWLTAPASVLWQRISTDPATAGSRPSLTDWHSQLAGLDGIGELEQLAKERSPLYQRAADLIVETDGLSPRQVAQAILDKLNRAHRQT